MRPPPRIVRPRTPAALSQPHTLVPPRGVPSPQRGLSLLLPHSICRTRSGHPWALCSVPPARTRGPPAALITPLLGVPHGRPLPRAKSPHSVCRGSTLDFPPRPWRAAMGACPASVDSKKCPCLPSPRHTLDSGSLDLSPDRFQQDASSKKDSTPPNSASQLRLGAESFHG